MLGVDIRSVSVDEARVIRDAVLRPGLAPGRSIYPGDEAEDTVHFGAFVGEKLGAVATVCREPFAERVGGDAWRLRGMATLAQLRGLGLGKRLAEVCLAHAADCGGTLAWCSARVITAGFYLGLGFRQEGEAFRLPEYSDEVYILMVRIL